MSEGLGPADTEGTEPALLTVCEAALTRGNVTQPHSADPVERFVAGVKWRFAKTMPTYPHWYVMRQWNPERGADFMELVRRIFDEDRDEQWAVGTPYERTVRYYYSGEYKYWVMDPTIEATDLINRARIDGKGPADGFEF